MQNNSGYTRLYTHMVFNTLPIDVFQSIHVLSQLTKAHCLVVSPLVPCQQNATVKTIPRRPITTL